MTYRTSILTLALLAAACTGGDEAPVGSDAGTAGSSGQAQGGGGADASADEAAEVGGASGSAAGTGGSSAGSGGSWMGDAEIVNPGDTSSPEASSARTDATTTCVSSVVLLPRGAVYFLFVLDGSNSMNHDGKWLAATAALHGVFTDMQAAADPGVGAGLIVFSDVSDPNSSTGGGYPSTVDVPVAFVDSTHLNKLLGRTAPPDEGKGNTPTGPALTGAYASLASFQPAVPLLPNGKKVTVLLTDGVPTDADCKTAAKDGTDDYLANACIKLAASQHLSGAPQGAIDTFVIGIGPLPGDFATYDPNFLGALAVAGGTAPAGCNPKSNSHDATDRCYFNIDTLDLNSASAEVRLLSALDDIRNRANSCTLDIPPSSQQALDPALVNVAFKGALIPNDPSNGWTFDDFVTPKRIMLHGASCDAVQGDRAAETTMLLGCLGGARGP